MTTFCLDRHVCIIGLGYVGLTLAVAMCDAGFLVEGIERDERILNALGQKRAHFFEVGLDQRIAKHIETGSLTFTDKLRRSDQQRAYVITVGTPLTPQKHTNTTSISTVVLDVANVLRPEELVMLRSTVRVGATRQIAKPILDEAGVPYLLAFCPERTLEGKAIEELRSLPQIIGGIDARSVLQAKILFSHLTPTVIAVHSIEAAEMVKLVNNTQRDYLFAFANEIAEMCDTVGVSAIEVIEAGSLGYPRGFRVYPGPVGGPCLEKDPYILAEGITQKGGAADLILEARRFNEQLPGRSTALIANYFKEQGREPTKIVVFGLAFKGRPETSDLRGSLAYPLISELRAQFPDATIGGFDPSVDTEEARSFRIDLYKTWEEAASGADAILFQTNNPKFQAIDLYQLSQTMNENGMIYDYWNQFKDRKVESTRRYGGLGTWSQIETAA